MSQPAPEHVAAAKTVVNQYLMAGLQEPKRPLEDFVASAIQEAVDQERVLAWSDAAARSEVYCHSQEPTNPCVCARMRRDAAAIFERRKP